MRSLKAVTLIILLFAGYQASAESKTKAKHITYFYFGVGIKGSYMMPQGGMSQYFNNKVIPEIMLVSTNDLGEKWRWRIGLATSKLSPRLDSFPTYKDNSSVYSTTTVVPGTFIIKKHTMTYLYGDVSYPVIHELKGFSLYLGGGVVGGIPNTETEITYADGGKDGTSGIIGVVGVRATGSITYRINGFFDVFAEAATNRMLSSHEVVKQYSHNLFSLGINCFFNNRDDD